METHSKNSWPCVFTGHLRHGSDTRSPRNCSASLKIILINQNMSPYILLHLKFLWNRWKLGMEWKIIFRSDQCVWLSGPQSPPANTSVNHKPFTDTPKVLSKSNCPKKESYLASWVFSLVKEFKSLIYFNLNSSVFFLICPCLHCKREICWVCTAAGHRFKVRED